QRALPDGQLRHRTDADQACLVLPGAVEMSSRERVARVPLLPAGGDELTLVLTDRTSGRRLLRRRELAAAGLTEEGGHSVRRSETITLCPLSRGAPPAQMPHARSAPCTCADPTMRDQYCA